MTLLRFLSPASFWSPEYICQSAWLEHAPFAFWICDVLRPRCFVELGTHHGYSYFAFCQAIDRLALGTAAHAVDTWQGDEHAGFYDEDVFQAVAEQNTKKYAAFSRLIRSTFDEALQNFEDGSIDLLHIDGRHFYDDVKHDFESWRPKLSDNAILLFHDTSVRERGFGVWEFFKELSGSHPTFQFFHSYGLGVLAIGEAPVALAPLFESSAEEAGQIRTAYTALGNRLSVRLMKDTRLAEQDARLTQQSAQLTQQSAQLAEKDAQLMERDARLAAISAQLAERSAQLDECVNHLDRINAWGWFRLGLFLDRLIQAPVRVVTKLRWNVISNERSKSIASSYAGPTSRASDAAELCRENALIQSELARVQGPRPSNAAATIPTTRLDTLRVLLLKQLLSSFEKSCRRAAQRLHIPIIARDQGSRPLVLFASDYLPLHDQQSGGLRQQAIIEILRDLGFPVLFASTRTKQAMPGVLSTEKGRKDYEEVLRKAGVVEFAYGLEEITACLRRQGPLIRRAIISFPHVAKDLIPLVRAEAPYASIFYDMVDFHSLRLRREADLAQDPHKQAEAQAMETTELDLARSADVVITISDTEKELMLEKIPQAVVEIIPNIFKPVETALPGPQGRKNILFVGGFWHKPNSDGVTWFVNEIWPKIRSHEPDVQFIIAGSNADAEVKALEQKPGVKVIGYVQDLTPVFDACRVFVAPLRYGAGMKGKVGQCLTFGLPLVSTSIGAEGIPIEPDEDFLLANNADEFAGSVIRLLRDDELWRKFQRHGQDIMTAHFSPRTISSQVGSLFNV